MFDSSLKSQVVSLQTAHSWANWQEFCWVTHASVAGSFRSNYTIVMKLVREKLKLINLLVNHAQYDGV